MLVIKTKMLNLYTAWDDEKWLYCVIGLKNALDQGKKYAKKNKINEICFIDIKQRKMIIKTN